MVSFYKIYKNKMRKIKSLGIKMDKQCYKNTMHGFIVTGALRVTGNVVYLKRLF